MSSSRIRRFASAPWRRALIALGAGLDRARDAIAQARLPRFATAAPGLTVRWPFEVRHPERVHLGRDVRFGPNTVLLLMTTYPGGWMRHPDGDHVEHRFDPQLRIGDRVTVTYGLHVTVYDRVTIGDDVMFAGNVYIEDGTHARRRGDVAYKYQGIERIAPVSIGHGAWIGQNAVILPGVRVGDRAIIGANTVVTRDVPDACIAVGAPARIVRRWDSDTARWTAARLDADPRDPSSEHGGTT